MNPEKIKQYGDELYAALRAQKTVKPLTSRESDLSIDDAYRISRHQLERRLADGERLSSEPQSLFAPSITLKPACLADSWINLNSLARRTLPWAYISRTSAI